MIDLKKLKSIIYDDIEILLDYFEIEYEIHQDHISFVCPIHEGADNKSACSISPNKKSWKCWTHDCHSEHGGILGFIMGVMTHRGGVEASFGDALKLACNLYNIGDKQVELDAVDKVEPAYKEFSNLVKTFDQKEIVTQSDFVFDINTCVDSKYFIGRGFKKETLEHFEVCDCVDRSSDMFMRAIIPVYNKSNTRVGYIARAIKNYMEPKYLFSKGFKKTQYLYNYNHAIKPALEKSCLFITEGQGDVWRLYECGVYNAISVFGKDISPEQEKNIISSGVTTLVVLADSDQPGREAKIRMQRMFTRMFTVKFPHIHRNDVGDMSIEKVKSDILPQVRGLY